MTSSVVAAFLDSGALNAGTPLEMASTPVSAVQPAEKACRIRNSVRVWVGCDSFSDKIYLVC
jgi:hypothetical protein